MLKIIVEGICQPHLKLLDWFVIILWPTAWACHLVMSVAWVKGKRLGRLWAAGGTFAGIASFLVWPAYSASMPAPDFMVEASARATLTLMITQLVLVSPCIVLAIWLVRFHWKKPVFVCSSA